MEPSASTLTPATVRAQVAAELYPAVRLLFTVGSAIGMGTGVLVEAAAGRGTWSLWIQAAIMGLAIIASWLPLPRSVGLAAILGGLLLSAAVALARYGPLGGNALILLAACFVAALFLGRRGAVVVGALAAAVFLGIGLLVMGGLLPAPEIAAMDPRRLTTWQRTGTSIAVLALALVFLFERFISALERLAQRLAGQRLQLAVAAREREEALAALAGAQRLGSLGQLAAGAAHDFRNALTVILAAAEEIQQVDAGAQVARAAGDIEHSARSAAQTAGQLLAFGRPAEREATCLPDVVATQVASTLDRVLPVDVRVVAETAPCGRVALEAGTLAQALLNLALNARDAMPAGGTITMRVAAAPGGGSVVEVADTGVGMDAATRARALEPFFTTKAAGQGSGLGLAMVRDVVERTQGALQLDSAPGRGTTVRLVFPPAPAAQPTVSA